MEKQECPPDLRWALDRSSATVADCCAIFGGTGYDRVLYDKAQATSILAVRSCSIILATEGRIEIVVEFQHLYDVLAHCGEFGSPPGVLRMRSL